MAKTFECSDAGLLCRTKVKGESEEEVLEQAVAHAREAHGVDLSGSSTLTRYAASLIRDDSATAE